MSAAISHKPVMLREVLAGLNVKPGGRYVDGTVGAGGHASAIMDAASPGGSLLGMDKDAAALERAAHELRQLAAVGHQDQRLVVALVGELEQRDDLL